MTTFAFAKSPDGGIGRRVGLKHQYFRVYGFESRSGHIEKETTDTENNICVGRFRFIARKTRVFWHAFCLILHHHHESYNHIDTYITGYEQQLFLRRYGTSEQEPP